MSTPIPPQAAEPHPAASDTDTDAGEPRWRIIGPGLVVAATGVGAADMVATLVAGSRYGYTLLWAVILGVILKIILVEGAGRYTLATGKTIFEGWRSLGRWTAWYFGPYILIWGFVYGATAMSSAALPLAALFPSVDLKVWAVLMGVGGLGMIWLGRYAFFEKVTAVLVGIMFFVVVGLALIALPNVPAMAAGLVPRIPEGGIIYTLALAGGVGGTITLAAYGYWLREKGWYTPKWMKVMRLDNTMAYVMTGIFVVSMLIVGVEVVQAAGVSINSGDEGLLDLQRVLNERYGAFIGTAFLVGFWAASFSSILGVWNGVSLMFADYWGHMRGVPSGHPDTRVGGRYFKFYLLWLTFPPMVLFLLNKPVGLILAYGVLGSLFMPFLALTLLGLLNGRHVPKRWANGLWRNLLLGLTAAIFVTLAARELYQRLSQFLGA